MSGGKQRNVPFVTAQNDKHPAPSEDPWSISGGIRGGTLCSSGSQPEKQGGQRCGAHGTPSSVGDPMCFLNGAPTALVHPGLASTPPHAGPRGRMSTLFPATSPKWLPDNPSPVSAAARDRDRDPPRPPLPWQRLAGPGPHSSRNWGSPTSNQRVSA